MQVVLSVSASIPFLQIGLIKGYNSSALPSMRLVDPHLVPNYETMSWIASTGLLMTVPSLMMVGPLIQRTGRKRFMIMVAPLLSASWFLYSFSPNTAAMIACKIAASVLSNVLVVATQLYVAECASAGVRGRLFSLLAVSLAAGITASYTLGAWLPWHQLARANSLPALLLVVLLPRLPESPGWLRLKGRHEEATRAAAWLGLPHQPSQLEPLVPTRPSLLKSFMTRPVIVPFLMTLMLYVFQQSCGNDAVLHNTLMIFQASNTHLNPKVCVIAVGCVLLIFSVVSLFWIDSRGRRFNLLISSSIMSLSMSGLALFFTLQSYKLSSSLSFLPLASLITYIGGYSLGFGAVPYLFSSEVLPLQQRSVLKAAASAVGNFAMFVEVKTYFNILEWFGQAAPFWIYSMMNLVSFMAVYFIIPETKGRTLEEIESNWKAKYKNTSVIP